MRPSNAPHVPRSRLPPRAGAVLVGLVLALLSGELLVRLFDVPPRPLTALALPTFQVSANPIRRFEYRPNLSADTPALTQAYEGLCTNSAGFRDVERTCAKPPGTRRVVVLGDSIAAGYGVEDAAQCFVMLLEQRLNRSGPGSFEALNLAVAGYQTMQEVETLRERGLAYAPDLVLVVFCVNDTRVAGFDRFLAQLVRQGEEQHARRTLLGRLLSSSRLAFVGLHRLRALAPRGMDRYQREVLGGRSPVEAGLALLAELRREHGFEALVVVVPAFDRPFEDYAHGAIHAEAAAAAATAGIELVDLSEAFAARPESPEELAFDGLHLTPAGHLAMSELLEPLVRARLGP